MMWPGKEAVTRGWQLPWQADYGRHTVGTFRKILARDSPEGDQVTDASRPADLSELTFRLPFPWERVIYLFMSTHTLPPGSRCLYTSLLIIAKISIMLQGNVRFPKTLLVGMGPLSSSLD